MNHLNVFILLATLFRTCIALQGDSQVAFVDKSHQVPGDNPVEYCIDESDSLLIIKNLDISPNPPVPGANLSIEATGYVKETITEGSYIDVEVKYGYVKLLTQRLDLCEQVEQIDMKCPIKKGPLNLSKIVELPSQIPPVSYLFLLLLSCLFVFIFIFFIFIFF